MSEQEKKQVKDVIESNVHSEHRDLGNFEDRCDKCTMALLEQRKVGLIKESKVGSSKDRLYA